MSFDTIVIGGGIAGLLTALRLARAGQAVALVEADRLGAGATCANHGMLHSGALYARRHPHIVRHCQQARGPFTALLADAELTAGNAVYVLPHREAGDFRTHLDRHHLPYQRTDTTQVPELDPSLHATHTAIAVPERVFSSRRIVTILTGQCLAAGVTILTGTTVERITLTSGKITGVIVGATEQLASRHVVIAAGIGTAQLLADLRSRQTALLKSRLDMMIHFPGARFARGLIFAAPNQPVVMPAPRGGVLASFFGGPQPQITGRRAYPVNLTVATTLLRQTIKSLAPTLVDPEQAVVYVAGKTDYVGTPHTENGVVNPGYHVIDHTAADGIAGLHTVITGKMTLGFHASKAAADAILGTDLPLTIPPQPAPVPLPRLVAIEPWAPPGQL